MRSFLLLFICLLISFRSNAQATFALTAGGAAIDDSKSVIHTADDDYLVAGQTNSYGAGMTDVYLIKINADGNLMWTLTVGDSGIDMAYSVIETHDGKYVISGTSISFDGSQVRFYIIKVSPSGHLIWAKDFAKFGLVNFAFSVVETADYGYAFAGPSASATNEDDFFLAKTDSAGDFLWANTYGNSQEDYCTGLIQTHDHGFAMVGYTNSIGSGGADAYVIKVDSAGGEQWATAVGGGNDEFGYGITETTSGNYVITGFTESFGAGNADVYVVKLNQQGNLIWTKTIGGSGDDGGQSVIESNDGNYVVAGSEMGFATSGTDAYLLKMDTTGTLIWARSIVGTGDDGVVSVVQTSTGGYVAAGGIYGFGGGNDLSVFVVMFRPDGTTCMSTTAGGDVSTGGTASAANPAVIPQSLSVSNDGTASSGGVRTVICSANIGLQNLQASGGLAAFPDPSSGIINLSCPLHQFELSVYNASGVEVLKQQMNDQQVQLDLTSLPDGFYQLIASENERHFETKTILSK